MVSGHIQFYPSDDSDLYRNIEPLCCVTGTNTALQVNYIDTSKTNPQKNRTDLWLPEAEQCGEGQLDKDSQKMQTSRCKEVSTMDMLLGKN